MEPEDGENDPEKSHKTRYNLEITILRNMIFNTLIENWLRTSRDSTLIESVLITLSSVAPLLPKNSEEYSTVKLTPILLNLCKKFINARLAVSR